MAVSIENLKEYVSGEKAKQSTIKTAKDYISRFRDAESVKPRLRGFQSTNYQLVPHPRPANKGLKQAKAGKASKRTILRFRSPSA